MLCQSECALLHQTVNIVFFSIQDQYVSKCTFLQSILWYLIGVNQLNTGGRFDFFCSYQLVIVRVYLSLSSRLGDLKGERSESPWSLNGEDSEQIHSK